MLTVRLDPDLEQRLDKLAAATRRSKSHYVKEALQRYLDENEAHLTAFGALEIKGYKPTLEDLRRMIEIGEQSPDAEDFSFEKLNEKLDRKLRNTQTGPSPERKMTTGKRLRP